jgi:hypothetical protein
MDEDLKAKWDALAEAWITSTAAGKNVHRNGLLDSWMLDAVEDVQGKDVIDLGVRRGTVLSDAGGARGAGAGGGSVRTVYRVCE